MGMTNNPQAITIYRGNISGSESLSLFKVPPGEVVYIVGLQLSTVANVAASDTNYAVVSVQDGGQDGSGTTTVTSYSTKATGGDGAITAGNPVQKLAGSTADFTAHKLDAGDVLKVDIAITGTLTLTGLVVTVLVVYGDPADLRF